jgi:hypothetical protein
MDAVNSQSDWDEAMARLLAFFSTLRIGGVEHRVRVALRILEEARRRHQQERNLAPVQVAMRVAEESLDRWFANTIGAPPGRRIAMGLVALELTDAAVRFPGSLLLGEPSEALKALLAGVSVRTGPQILRSQA